jgi:hypothetical protein
MPKKAVSLTLDEANLLWLRGRTTALGSGSLSETLDRLITEARAGRIGTAPPARSVVGTIDIAEDDPTLEHADAAIQNLFTRSISRPFRVREPRASYSRSLKRPRSRRG